MKLMRRLFFSLLIILFSAPMAFAQDFSRYRNFSFGMTVAAVEAELVPQEPRTKLIQAPPALIQELTWWPRESAEPALRTGSLWQVLFTFYDGHLYRMLVTYDRRATQGMTDDDMVRAISGHYGSATHPKLEISFPTNELYRSTETVIARWEDPQYSFNLFRSSYLNVYGLVMFAKGTDEKVRSAFAASTSRGVKTDLQKESERQEKVARELEATREKNKRAFRP